MGNDGGTIVKRMHFVRTRAEGSKGDVDPALKSRLQATSCALSHEPLCPPVVGDRLGKLYNKESLVKLLLRRAEGNATQKDGELDHVRNLKDVKTLNLTINSAIDVDQRSEIDAQGPAQFLCPLTQREMDGRYRFIYLNQCGCVMSENGLRHTLSEQQGQDAAEVRASCPVCSQQCVLSFSGKRLAVPGSDVVIINGTADEIEQMRATMSEKRATEKAKKKDAKNAKRNGDEQGSKRKRDEQDDKAATDRKKIKDVKKADGQRQPVTVV
jgi:hypothetical protein